MDIANFQLPIFDWILAKTTWQLANGNRQSSNRLGGADFVGGVPPWAPYKNYDTRLRSILTLLSRA